MSHDAECPAPSPWFVYLARGGDGTFYAGITTDLSARLAAHNEGRGAAYTRGRGPIVMVHQECLPDRSAALKREAAIKRMSRAGKLRLVDPSFHPVRKPEDSPPKGKARKG